MQHADAHSIQTPKSWTRTQRQKDSAPGVCGDQQKPGLHKGTAWGVWGSLQKRGMPPPPLWPTTAPPPTLTRMAPGRTVAQVGVSWHSRLGWCGSAAWVVLFYGFPWCHPVRTTKAITLLCSMCHPWRGRQALAREANSPPPPGRRAMAWLRLILVSLWTRQDNVVRSLP